jgi:hypothetical protein
MEEHGLFMAVSLLPVYVSICLPAFQPVRLSSIFISLLPTYLSVSLSLLSINPLWRIQRHRDTERKKQRYLSVCLSIYHLSFYQLSIYLSILSVDREFC